MWKLEWTTKIFCCVCVLCDAKDQFPGDRVDILAIPRRAWCYCVDLCGNLVWTCVELLCGFLAWNSCVEILCGVLVWNSCVVILRLLACVLRISRNPRCVLRGNARECPGCLCGLCVRYFGNRTITKVRGAWSESLPCHALPRPTLSGCSAAQLSGCGQF